MSDLKYTSPTCSARLLWAVAVADGPTTATAVAREIDADRDAVGSTLTGLWRAGYLVRRSVVTDGSRCYEYALAPPEDGHE